MDPKNWLVTLNKPTTVHDVLRRPIEGAIPCSEKEAERLFGADMLEGDPVPVDLADEDVIHEAAADGATMIDADDREAVAAAFARHAVEDAALSPGIDGTDGASGEPAETPADLRDLKLADLRALALKEGVPLNDANTKPTIIDAFVAHRAKA